MESTLVLDDLGPDGFNPKPRRIRLVERVPPVGLASGRPAVGVTDPLPKEDSSKDATKDQRKGKKGKKARRQADRVGATPEAKAPGHLKKVKATKRLAAELQELGGALTQLRARLSDLHSIQLDHAESMAALSRRGYDLDQLSVAERERGGRLAGRLEVLERVLDERLEGLDKGLRQMEAEALCSANASRTWTQSRLVRLARRQAWALGLVGLLGAGLIAMDWWRDDRLAAGITGRLEALERRPLAPSQSQVVPLPLDTQDLLERLRRLEAGLAEAARDLVVARQQAAADSGRLAELAVGQGVLVRGLDALRRDLAATDQEVAVLDERVSGLGRAALPASASGPSDSLPLEGPGYAVQLVAYHSRARIAPFVEEHGIGDRARVAEIRTGGRQAHAVLLGPYGSAAEASRAIGELPADLRDLRPWVRRLPSETRLQPWQ